MEHIIIINIWSSLESQLKDIDDQEYWFNLSLKSACNGLKPTWYKAIKLALYHSKSFDNLHGGQMC